MSGPTKSEPNEPPGARPSRPRPFSLPPRPVLDPGHGSGLGRLDHLLRQRHELPHPGAPASVTFTPEATSVVTAFDSAANTWRTTAPSGAGQDVFLAGRALP